MSPTIIFSAIALGVAGFLATSGDNLLIAIGLFILADTPTDVFGMVPARW